MHFSSPHAAARAPPRQLPEEDRNFIVTIPASPLIPDPSLHVSKDVSNWVHRYNTLAGDKNPSSPEAFRKVIRIAKEWSEQHGRPIHMGEFRCYVQADAESRIRFFTEFRKALAEAGMGWAIWDWKAGFRYWDDRKAEPVAGMREALFGSDLVR